MTPALYPFQDAGADFLALRTTAFLGDEMGLGKTPQAIAAAGRAGARTIGVVCPAAARVTWRAEFEKWAHLFRGGVSHIASYDQVRNHTSSYWGVPVDVLVLDEAHRLKSVYGTRKGKQWTGRTEAVYGNGGIVHQAGAVWALSGTPAPNDVSELWTHLRVLKALDMGYEDFRERYCTFDLRGNVVGVNHLDELKGLLDGWLLRRYKKDVLPDLPPIRFETVLVQAFRNAAGYDLKEHEGSIGRLTEEDLDDAEFAPLATLRRLTGEVKAAPYLERLKMDLDGGLAKVVVMAHHREILKGLHRSLGAYGSVLFMGGMTDTQRAVAVRDFQEGPARVFLGQLDAASENLTLTAADTLDMLESSWTPGTNQQAAMRVHRIGQNRGVRIRYITLADSLDVVIQAVARRKAMTLMNLYT